MLFEMRGRAVVIMALAAGALLLLFASAAAGRALRAHPASEPPPTVASTSLSQSGQNLVWRAQLSRPFSAASLKRDNTALCLLLERASSGQTAATLCLIPGPHNRPPDRLELGGGKVVAATVNRPSTNTVSASFLPTSVGLAYQPLRWQVRVQSTANCVGQCATLSPAQPQLLTVRAVKLVGCVATGSNFVFHGPTNVRDIALAFDDGPWYDTPQFLSLLERENVPATFFQIGEQISQYGGKGGSVDRRMLRDGDMIGDHTWTHPNMPSLSSSAQRSQIASTANAISRATGGFRPCLFRAPYGATSPGLLSLVRSMGMTTIQWNVDPRDWAMPGVGEIESNVINNASGGSILEMHDGGGNRSETLAALPTIINTLRRRGYKFVTLTQMLGYRLIYK